YAEFNFRQIGVNVASVHTFIKAKYIILYCTDKDNSDEYLLKALFACNCIFFTTPCHVPKKAKIWPTTDQKGGGTRTSQYPGYPRPFNQLFCGKNMKAEIASPSVPITNSQVLWQVITYKSSIFPRHHQGPQKVLGRTPKPLGTPKNC
ncbi:hypothetical protein SK128_021186, partial [Halocaridina rubra]